ncbi:MAG TPA: MopE-related protein, partial [Desulfosalsimonadaceae bacterium]|nr:MopE-related protein [Desulfosalsimonadaceae bacterium]
MYYLTVRKLMYMLLIIFFCGNILLGCDDSDSDSNDEKAGLSGTTETTWYKDADSDGYGDPEVSIAQSSQPINYIMNSDDCNDYDDEVYPGAPELCDGKDNNCNGEVDEGACDLKEIELSGKIKNLAAAKDYISEEVYLQLVSMPETGNLDFETDREGRRVYSSDLATTEIQSADSFQFEILSLLPGTYVIAAQSLEPYAPDNEISPILSTSTDEFARIIIPDDYTPPLEIELGEVFIPLPEAITQNENSGSQNVQSPPMAPGVSATDGSYTDRVRITWDAPEGATAYEVYRADSYMGSKEKIANTSETRYDDTAIPCGESYYYWVKAKNSYGASNFFYSDLGYRKCPVPSAPINLSASDSEHEDMVSLSWNEVVEASAYDIYRAASSGGEKIQIGSVETTNYNDTNAACGVTYYYWVKATNSTDESGFSSYAQGSLSCSNEGDNSTSVGSLSTPTGLSATEGAFVDKIRLKWNASSRASSYDIYRATRVCGEKTKIGSASSNIFDDTSVPNRALYYYWVKAKNSAGESEYCDHDTGYLMRLPSPPTGVSASDGKYIDKILVKWNAVSNATSYDIYRADWPEGEKTKISTTSRTSIYDNTVECSSCKTGICGPKDYTYFVK